jgi:hypothetical protein
MSARLGLFSLLLTSVSAAATPPTFEARRFAESPTLDGVLDDAAWKAIAEDVSFSERKPALRATPPVATGLRVGYDDEALWFAVRCDDVPGGVTARTLTRDSFEIFSDDALSVKLDVFRDNRTTLGFVTNPLGAQLDYQAIEDGKFRAELDLVWDVAVSRRDDGWTLEMRIPFRSLGIDPARLPAVMGLNLSRDHARRNATYDWSLMPPPYSPIAASLYGNLVGLGTGEAGTGVALSVTPFTTLGIRAEGDGGPADGTANAGVDARLTVGTGTRATVTINTDFAQADVDDQVVNLDRFGLFLPEKRDFFLTDVELFEVGRREVTQPLYTRRLGLRQGKAVSVLGGLKVASRPLPGLRFGLLQVTTRPGPGTPWTSSTAARIEALGEKDSQWTVGGLLTHRQGDDANDFNVVFGLDGAYRGPLPLLIEAAVYGSLTGSGALAPDSATGGLASGLGQDEPAPAATFRALYRGALVRPSLDYAWLEPGFRADLGFVRRTGVQTVDTQVDVEPRLGTAGLEKVTITTAASVVLPTDASELLDWTARAEAALLWDAGYRIALGGGYREETVRDAFTVGDGTRIDPGVYGGAFGTLSLSSPGTKSVYASLDGEGRAYFGGWLVGGAAAIAWKPVEQARFELAAEYRRGLMGDEPDFDAVVFNGRLALGFTRSLGLDLYGGTALLDDQASVSARLRFGYLPGSDLFLVYQLDLDTAGETRVALQSLLAKLTLRWDPL